MEFTFNYDVETTTTNVQIASVTFKEELTRDQSERLLASAAAGKYFFLNEDESISDIYDMIHDTAIQLEEQEEYGDLVGTVVEVTNFRYPEELWEDE